MYYNNKTMELHVCNRSGIAVLVNAQIKEIECSGIVVLVNVS